MLDRLEALLKDAAKAREMLTYRQVAEGLVLQPPQTIHQTTVLLEALMRRQASIGVPQLASLVVSRRGRLPAPGFFLLLAELGIYSGSVAGDDAHDYHEAELQRCFETAGA